MYDANWRLSKAEESFAKAYGKNNERLIELKGGSCPELVIFVRLYILQAVVFFHTSAFDKSMELILKAEDILKSMTITEEDILPLIEMGFTPTECRIALRACSKNTQAAAQWIFSRREKIKEKQEEERIHLMKKTRQKKIWEKCSWKSN